MIEPISKTEKSDILLTLALAFEKKLGETDSDNIGKTASQLTEKFSAVLSAEDCEKSQNAGGKY